VKTQDQEEYCAQVVLDMQRWLERAVIGLNLCPFAKAVHVKGLIRYVVCLETNPVNVLNELETELLQLAATSAKHLDTGLLILPNCFQDFFEFTSFLMRVDKLLSRLALEGVLQVASFHPDFQFAGTEAGDIGNYTNRAPYPALHLLRESSIDRAVKAFPNAEDIFEKNIETLKALGHSGWDKLDLGPHTEVLIRSKS
jgi:hypothetical protein